MDAAQVDRLASPNSMSGTTPTTDAASRAVGDEPPTLSSLATSWRHRWGRRAPNKAFPHFALPSCWLTLNGITLVLLGLAWLVDAPVAQLANAWYNGPEPLNGELHQVIVSLAMYGQMLGIAAALVLIMIFDVRRRGLALMLASILVAVGLGSAGAKSLFGRVRPLASDGKTQFVGPGGSLQGSNFQSFPSGHTATAFALSYTLGQCYPQTRVMVWTLAFGTGFNRVITVRHFLSDVIAGAWLGYALAVLMGRWSWLKRQCRRVSTLLAPNDHSAAHADTLSWSARLRRSGRALLLSPALLLLVSLCLNWAGNGQSTLWDRDEPRFATATREMMNRGDWIVPTFNQQLRPDKPILIYWTMRAAYNIFGDGPFAARFTSGLAGALACLVIFALGRSMFDRRVGLIAGWMLALAPMVMAESKLATADALLFVFTVLSISALWKITQFSNGQTGLWRWQLLFWVSLALGGLTKGPVILAVVMLTGLGYSIIGWKFAWWKNLGWLWGPALLIVLVSPWIYLVQQQTGGAFLDAALGHHVVKRSLTPLENHRGFPGFYLVSLIVLFVPWAWLLPWSVKQHAHRWRSDLRLAFLAGWAIGPLLMFELVATKLVHYYLPAYPALALWLASALVGRFKNTQTSSKWAEAKIPVGKQPRWGISKLPRWAGLVWASLGVVAAMGVTAFASIFLPWSMAMPTIMAGLVMGGGILLAGRLLANRRPSRAFALYSAAWACGLLIIFTQVVPQISHQQLIVKVAEHLKDHPPQDTVALWEFADPSLIYNTGRSIPVVVIWKNNTHLGGKPLLEKEGQVVCPMTPKLLKTLNQIDPWLETKVLGKVKTNWDPDGFKPREALLVRIKPKKRGRRPGTKAGPKNVANIKPTTQR